MVTFNNRKTPTLKEILPVLAAIVLVTHIWSILHVLEEIPAWVMRMDLWELAGAVSYTQVATLVESLLLLAVVVLAALLLPRRFFRDDFVVLGSLFVITLSLWTVLIQQAFRAIQAAWPLPVLIGVVPFLLSFVGVYQLARRNPRVRETTLKVLDRVSILAWVYLVLDFIAILVVTARNL